MVVAAHENPKVIRQREAALNARDAITNQYATSTKKETKTPSTKKSSIDVRPPLPLRKAPGSAKRNFIVVSSDDENQPPPKRQTPHTPAFQDNAPRQQNATANETVSRAEFLQLRSVVTKLVTESCGEKNTDQEMNNVITRIKESVVELAKVVEGYESTSQKVQIEALEILLMAERLRTRYTRLVENAEEMNRE
ncbi:uncharacterized protein N7498_004079 [Penicillium cinerascens]|uniref:Uncharacterized protein n=1 Tax=Penicillium cinerascens TaxID=70096 RepID=A0A9W9T7H9_9EURO|nr:uncharacterized protein N7498_004079 [Penicillium cinerascens]KAJ5212433.1 hypothetical protein N7498_004079 [Penicillium cinerascens]